MFHRFSSYRTAIQMAIAAGSVGLALTLQFWGQSPIDLRDASTAQLALLAALLFLPTITIALRQVESRRP
ncbi:MAG: hypothetical protein AAGI30_04220 [Planctomycetota bacterium]